MSLQCIYNVLGQETGICPQCEKRSKHIDICYHYIRKVICWKIVEVYFIEGEENPVDLLTKNIAKLELHLFHT